MYYNGKKVRNLYYNGKCITRLAHGKGMARLVEGDDFVRAQWLVGDGTAYIQGVTYDLWNNHLQIQIGRRDIPWTVNRDVISYGNASPASVLRVSDNSDGGGEFLQVLFRSESSNHIADIRPYSSVPDILDMDFYISNSIFYCIQGGVEHVNNETAHQDGWIAIEPKIYSDKLSYIREVLPDGSYNSNLVPCRLLRPIPAALDGNGIARNAGDCGMYNLVNGLFYGNVAPDGSFTVSDN